MKSLLLASALAALLPLTVSGQSLEAYRWQARLVIIFTPDIDDPMFMEQYSLLKSASEELDERMVQIMLVTPNGDHENTGIFLQESASEYYYDYFSALPNQLELVLVGLDGTEKFRAKNAVTPPSVLLELIDSMPMRQRELLQGYQNKSQINETGSVLPNKSGTGGSGY